MLHPAYLSFATRGVIVYKSTGGVVFPYLRSIRGSKGIFGQQLLVRWGYSSAYSSFRLWVRLRLDLSFANTTLPKLKRSIVISKYVCSYALYLCTSPSICPSVHLLGQNWRLNHSSWNFAENFCELRGILRGKFRGLRGELRGNCAGYAENCADCAGFFAKIYLNTV